MRVTERARVVSVERGRAAVAILPPDDEEKCRRCPAAAICGDRTTRPRVLVAAAREGVNEGDVVTVAIEGPSPAWAAFLLLILPLVVAFACGIGAWAALGSPAAGVVAGVIGAAGVYVAISLAGAGARGRVEIIDAEAPDGG
ncbi:MAG: SoxR reducing system RseC family protein [Planctomycetota bacterium]|jgi:positive regulator of sigma E activity